MEPSKNISNKIAAPLDQALLIVVTSIVLLLMTLKPLNTFKNFDPAPGIIENQIAGKIGIPTGIVLRNFLEFDMQKNDFSLEATIWFVVNPNEISVEQLSKFTFSKGQVSDKFAIVKINPTIKKISKEKQLVLFDVLIKFSSNLNFKLFPIDSHRLYLTLNNRYIDGNKFYFDIKDNTFQVADNIFTFGWNNIANHFVTGHNQIILDKTDDKKTYVYPRAIFSLDFVNSSIRNIMLIFMPLFIVFFLALFAFSYDPGRYRGTIMSISAAVVPAMLGYRFVIEAVSPKVSYFTLGDQIFNLFLLLSFLLFFINTFYLNLVKKYRGLFLLAFHLILIISWYYLLYIWAA